MVCKLTMAEYHKNKRHKQSELATTDQLRRQNDTARTEVFRNNWLIGNIVKWSGDTEAMRNIEVARLSNREIGAKPMSRELRIASYPGNNLGRPLTPREAELRKDNIWTFDGDFARWDLSKLIQFFEKEALLIRMQYKVRKGVSKRVIAIRNNTILSSFYGEDYNKDKRDDYTVLTPANIDTVTIGPLQKAAYMDGMSVREYYDFYLRWSPPSLADYLEFDSDMGLKDGTIKELEQATDRDIDAELTAGTLKLKSIVISDPDLF